MIVLVLRPRAVLDLRQIATHIALEDAGAATRLRSNIDHRLDLLQRFPEASNPRPELGPAIITISVGNYVIITRFETTRIVVLRVLHSARDLRRHIKGRS
jgi:toxin ParE1/3/4